MKRCFLYAYDHGNLGDDLFMQTVTARYPHVQFYIWGNEASQPLYRQMVNLKPLDKSSRWMRMLGRIRPSLAARYIGWMEQRCDAVAYVGGSIFIEYPEWENSLSWWKYEAAHTPLYVLGANFGPYHTAAYRAGMDEAFAAMEDVCFRDRYSLEQFPGNPRVRQAPDILLGCEMPRVPVVEKQIFVSVIHCASRDGAHGLAQYDEHYVRSMAGILKRYLADGCRIVLASFCKEEGDEIAVARIRTAIGDDDADRVTALCYDGTNSEEMLQVLAASDYVIASRFHGTILAMAAGRPVLPVIYSDKMKHVLEDLDFRGTAFDLRSAEPWSYEASRENWAHPMPVPETVRQAAQRHFEKLDLKLGKG